MLTTYYDPFRFFTHLVKELEKTGYHNLAKTDEPSSASTSAWMPSVDIHEEAERFLIRADLPGVTPEEIDISMENSVLTIRGERKQERNETQGSTQRMERIYGTFYRRFTLPDTADADGIKAASRRGVLELTIPKKPTSQPRKITVDVQEA